MSQKISEIYTAYRIPHNLQLHMLRVAAVAMMICDNYSDPVEKEDVVTACLFHDMGNIIKYDMSCFPQYLEPEGLEYWQNVQNKFIKKYGNNEHKATIQIMKECNLSSKIVDLVDQVGFHNFCLNSTGNKLNIKIVNYADTRVDPHGVVSYDERMDEAKKRYQNRTDLFPLEKRDELISCGKEIEKQIFAKCKIKPEDINNETVASLILELKNFVIK